MSFFIVQTSCRLCMQNNTLLKAEGFAHLQQLCSVSDSSDGCSTIPCISLFHVLLLHARPICWLCSSFLPFAFMYTFACCLSSFFNASFPYDTLHSIAFALSLQLYHSRWTLQIMTSRKMFWFNTLSHYRLRWLAFRTIRHQLLNPMPCQPF